MKLEAIIFIIYLQNSTRMNSLSVMAFSKLVFFNTKTPSSEVISSHEMHESDKEKSIALKNIFIITFSYGLYFNRFNLNLNSDLKSSLTAGNEKRTSTGEITD